MNIEPKPIALKNFLTNLTQSNINFFCQFCLKSSNAILISTILSSIEVTVSSTLPPIIFAISKPKILNSFNASVICLLTPSISSNILSLAFCSNSGSFRSSTNLSLFSLNDLIALSIRVGMSTVNKDMRLGKPNASHISSNLSINLPNTACKPLVKNSCILVLMYCQVIFAFHSSHLTPNSALNPLIFSGINAKNLSTILLFFSFNSFSFFSNSSWVITSFFKSSLIFSSSARCSFVIPDIWSCNSF